MRFLQASTRMPASSNPVQTFPIEHTLMTNTEFTLQHREQLFQASNEIVTQATIPIFRFDENQLRLHGTGVFLQIGDRHFILTAAHVLDSNVYHKIPLTLGSERNGGPPVLLNGAKIWQSDFPVNADVNDPEARLADPYDNAFIALTAEHAQSLMSRRIPITLQMLDLSEVPKSGCFLFLGFPGEYARTSTIVQMVSVEMFRYITELDSRNKANNGISVLFKYLPGSVYSDGSDALLPDLHGMSGCGVWRLSTMIPFEHWSLNDVKLVATEHEWNKKNHFIKATPVVHTIRAIYESYPDLRRIFDVNFGIQTEKWL
jgi:hypothetical protein